MTSYRRVEHLFPLLQKHALKKHTVSLAQFIFISTLRLLYMPIPIIY